MIDAINANPGASALVKAVTYRGSTGTGIVQPRTKVNLSDFLQPVTPMGRTDISLTNDHVQRGPFQQNVLRIRKGRAARRTEGRRLPLLPAARA